MSTTPDEFVTDAYRRVEACATIRDLRRLLAATYAATDDVDGHRLLMVHLRRFHLSDPDEINYWRDRSAKKDGPITLEAARVAVAEVLIQLGRDRA